MWEEETIRNIKCLLYDQDSSGVLLLQPLGAQARDSLGEELRQIGSAATRPFRFCGCAVEDWNRDLSPWEAPPAFGGDPFGGRAEETLRFVLEALLPAVGGQDRRVILGGYSLAGLFSLWAAAQTDAFDAVAAASPSVWFPGWGTYQAAHPPRAKAVYLSLGRHEERTRNRVMAPVGDNIRALYDCLRRGPACTACALEWHDGGHFHDPVGRTARAFAWALEHV